MTLTIVGNACLQCEKCLFYSDTFIAFHFYGLRRYCVFLYKVTLTKEPKKPKACYCIKQELLYCLRKIMQINISSLQIL